MTIKKIIHTLLSGFLKRESSNMNMCSFYSFDNFDGAGNAQIELFSI